MRVPPGISLLLVGSGLYWLLSSQLIASFSVLSPGMFQTTPGGESLVRIAGIVALSSGLWTLKIDLDEFRRLASSRVGCVFVIPVLLVALDLYSTLISLSLNSQANELNPFVAAAIQYGPSAVVPFAISYLALSQGLAFLMIKTGVWLFGERTASVLPFAIVCGIGSIGPFSNIIGIIVNYDVSMVYLLAASASAIFASLVFRAFRTVTALRAVILA